MKFAVTMRALLLLLAAAPALAEKSEAQSPVTKVVGMLKDLEKKLEEEAEAEKDLYDKFVCWGTGTLTEKKEAVARSTERIASLEAYVSDIDSGKLSFTSDKEKLESELADVTAQLNNITAEHAEQLKQFELNKENMESAISGLDEVITKLSDATGPTKKADGVALIGLRGGAVARRQKEELLRQGLRVSDEHLSKANRHFLRRILGGQAIGLGGEGVLATDSDSDDFKARSKGVTDSLNQVKGTIDKDLKKTVEDAEEAEKDFKMISGAKEDEKETAAAMLAKLEAEHAARAKALEDSKEEIETLSKQVAADEKLIPEVEKALEEKAAQMDQRTQYRLGEIQAVGEAISMLNSDESRDLFRDSFNFLQLGSVSSTQSKQASQALLSVYNTVKDRRLLSLNSLLHGAAGDAFDSVVAKINEMVAMLEEEEEIDLQKKTDCQNNKEKDEASKKATEREIDDLNVNLKYSADKVLEIDGEIKAKQDQIAETDAQLAKATEVRTAEAAEFEKASGDDAAAVTLLKQAAQKIQDFYDSQKSTKQPSLLQRGAARTHEEPAGAPKIFSEDYAGAGAQSSGVVGTMEMLAGNLEKEMAVAKKEEEEAAALFEDTKKELEEQKVDLSNGIDLLEKAKGDVNADKDAASGDKVSKTNSLEALLQKMKDVEPECTYYIDNFEKRSQNRQTEVNGLKQAKTILESSK
eukprot:gb/GFBE01017665.1/.p1 GENE.gb/GFBE01017665.1/~~gb/GFBE01017665.1/.p1  ORF type:complete len:697 (+),score=303.26 gb/GFBE01017665.1/:1-2091(+)